MTRRSGNFCRKLGLFLENLDLPLALSSGTGSPLLARNPIEGYVVALIETGLGGLVLETAVVVRKYDLQRLWDQALATDAFVVGVPERHKSLLQVSFVHQSRSYLGTTQHQMIAGTIETDPGHYRRTELVEDVDSMSQGVTGHDKFGMFRRID